jgi:CRISPR/Cas system CSM-associated protein Csm3 (group 7 of RAMP superfamily)
MSNKRLNRNQRLILERIIIQGTLILDTPACLGNGNTDGPTDLMLVRDSITNKALLTGASIAGALRNYVHEYQFGYAKDEKCDSLSTYLFGGIRKDEEADQSPLIINDSISTEIPQVELRDGVKIDIKTGTAADKSKYDLELLAAGTEFSVYFELLIEEGKDKNKLVEALIIALQGLENYEINIGMKKRRGFGRCHVDKWRVWQFNLKDPANRLAWLTFDQEWANKYTQLPREGKIKDILNKEIIIDQRHRFTMTATFKLVGSMLIRSSQFFKDVEPDVVHLKSRRNGKEESILSGTSLTGVLRHRAEKIVNTLGIDSRIIDSIFGMVEEGHLEKKPDAISSRLQVNETVIKKPISLIQNRIAIDRFTGGALHGALFDEQPIFGREETEVILDLQLCQISEDQNNTVSSNGEIGLLLLLLKDLWTSDLAVGGESSIGRGRLQGIKAEMKQYRPEGEKSWQIVQEDNSLYISDVDTLESFVSDLQKLISSSEVAA